MFCCSLLYVHYSFVIILIGKRQLVALLGLSCWCLVIVVWIFFTVPWVCLQFVIAVFPDHTHLLFFNKGRYIDENIHLIQETIELLQKESMTGLIPFFRQCLDSFNFGKDIIKWIKCFYPGANSCVKNAGCMSNLFSISRDVRQGCPLSPYLFIVCIEIVSSETCNNKKSKWVRYTVKLSLKSSKETGIELGKTILSEKKSK